MMRKKFLPFSLPLIEDEEKKEVMEVLDSGWLTTGPKVSQFEKEFAKFIGCRQAVAVSSGTAALHLALKAIGLQTKDEVIVPTITFAATAEVVVYFGAKPILVDCERNTLNINIEDVIRKLKNKKQKIRAIIPVHFAGQPCKIDEILEIAKKYNLKVIEDAAHALSARYKGKMIGTIGDITAFSFYATKNITTSEGGMITTNNNTYAEKMRILSLHGISKDAWKRYTNKGSWYYEILDAGYKYNMTDIQAAIGIHQLRKLNKLQAIRERYIGMYNEAFSQMPEIITPYIEEDMKHAWHLYVIQLDLELLKINRNRFIEELRRENIGTSVHFIPLHLSFYYQYNFGYKKGDFPNAEYVYDRIISLPLYPKMTKKDVFDVIEAVKKIVRKFRKKT